MENWLPSYRKEWLRPDVVAGLTTAAVVIPKAMAYATIAGLPVQVGLYTVLVPMAIYAVMGTPPAECKHHNHDRNSNRSRTPPNCAWGRSVVPFRGFGNADTTGGEHACSCVVTAT